MFANSSGLGMILFEGGNQIAFASEAFSQEWRNSFANEFVVRQTIDVIPSYTAMMSNFDAIFVANVVWLFFIPVEEWHIIKISVQPTSFFDGVASVNEISSFDFFRSDPVVQKFLNFKT